MGNTKSILRRIGTEDHRQELESERAAFQTRVTDYDGRADEIKKRLAEAEEAVKARKTLINTNSISHTKKS